MVIEFDGRDHRDRRTHRDDNIREEAFESAGLTVTRVDSLDLRRSQRQRLTARLTDAVDQGMARNRERDRWTTTPPGWWFEQVQPAEILTDTEKAEIFG